MFGVPECTQETCCDTEQPMICDLNCYSDHGAIDVHLEGDTSGLTHDQCLQKCYENDQCEAVLRHKGTNYNCDGKKDIHISKCLPHDDKWQIEIIKELPWGKCAILGDPHIFTFDRIYNSDIGKYDSGYFWLVKCQSSLIIEGAFAFTNMYPGESSLRGIAVYGEIIQNNVLLVGYVGDGEWEDGFKASWNGVEILSGYPSHFDSEGPDNEEPIMTAHKAAMNPDHFHEKARHTIGNKGELLPSFVFKFPHANLQIYCLLGKDAMNCIIEMKLLPEGCDGYCGNFNCVPADDTMVEIKKRGFANPIPPDETLFRDANVFPVYHFHAGATDVEDNCDAGVLTQAKQDCGSLDKGFVSGCIFDCCASPTGCKGIAALENAADHVIQQINKDVDAKIEKDEYNHGNVGR